LIWEAFLTISPLVLYLLRSTLNKALGNSK
jgi:hypothetical protein